MISSIARLQDTELFSEFTDEELSRVAPLCSDFVAIEESLIFTEGRGASILYLVSNGEVALQKAVRVPHGTRPRRTTVAMCRPGEVVGWSALVDPFKSTLSAMAWESCRLVSIDAKMLRRGLDMYPEMGYKAMTALSEVVARRLRQTTDALINERQVSFAGLRG